MSRTTHNQLSASVDSTSASLQIYFLVVVHGRMLDLPSGGLTFWGVGRVACFAKKFFLNGFNLVRFGAYFH